MQIVILGAGIVGLTMANLLARNKNLKIILIDSKIPNTDWDATKYDLRCSAINRATQNVFMQLDIWPIIIKHRFGMFDKMLIWENSSQTNFNFSAADIFEPDLGFIIENRVIHSALWHKFLEHENASFICGAANKLEKNVDYNRIYINNSYVDGSLIIGADGANSWLRTALNISTTSWDYKHTALVATIKTALPHNNIARQRFATDGPLAFLPLDQQCLSSIVWSSTPDKIQHLINLDSLEFCSILATEFDYKMGHLELAGARASFPLQMLHANTYISDRAALIGDAAHVVHPLAGQGMNLGIMDAVVLERVLNTAILNMKDIGSKNILRKYERERKSHNVAMLAVVEWLKRSFAVQNNLLQSVRNTGMQLINNINPIKNTMIRFAMGLD